MGLDFLLTGSQKALALPAGLAFAVASAEYIERARTGAESRLLLRRAAVRQVRREEIRRRARRRRRCSTRSRRRWATSDARASSGAGSGTSRCAMRRSTGCANVPRAAWHRLSIVAPEGSRSPTVTVIRLPGRACRRRSATAIKARGFTVGGGLRRAGKRHDHPHRSHGRSHPRRVASLPARLRDGDRRARRTEAARARVTGAQTPTAVCRGQIATSRGQIATSRGQIATSRRAIAHVRGQTTASV